MVRVVEITLAGDRDDVEAVYQKLLELLRGHFYQVAYTVQEEDHEEGLR